MLNRKHLKTVVQLAILIAVLITILFIWEQLVITYHIPKRILPAPSGIGDYLAKDLFSSHNVGYESLLVKVLQSFGDAVVGLIIAVVLGVSIAIIFAKNETFKIIISPFVFITQLLPVPAFAPIVAAVLGYGSDTKIFIIVLFIIFPVIVTTEKAILSIPENYLNLFKVYNANRRKELTTLILPAIIPGFFTTLKILCTASFITSILAELPLTVSTGIGKDIFESFNNQINTRVWASLLIISVISVLFFAAVSKSEKHILNTYHYGISD